MKNQINAIIIFFFLLGFGTKGQDTITGNKSTFAFSKLLLEPGIGLHPMPIADLRLSNILQLNAGRHLAFVSYSYYTRHNAFRRNFNHISTDYSFSLSQMFGAGGTLYGRKGSHTFSLLGGVKKESFRETLDKPQFDKVTASSQAITPEFAVLYSGRTGHGRYYLSYRVYLPLSPYPARTPDINAVDGNLSNVSLELGLGIRLR